MALVAGTTVGAGILALPAVTLPSGVLPSTAVMVGVWLYMAVSGLLIAEVNLQAIHQSGRPGLGLLVTIRRSLGKAGALVAGLVYAFVHYALLVAYMTRGGDILALALGHNGVVASFPLWAGHLIFVGLFGGLLFWGSEHLVGRVNSALVAVVIASFVGLVAFTLSHLDPTQWLSQNWGAVSAAIPVMFVALVYQNVVPVITTQLEGDRNKIRQSILLGTLIPLAMFLVWNAAILGSIPLDAMDFAGNTLFDPIEALRQGVASPWVGVAVSIFSEFAIATSFIGFVYGLLNFYWDVVGGQPQSNAERISLYSLVLIPPMGLSVLSPNVFFEAIDVAGAFGTSFLFGIIPAVMTWKQRYQEKPSPSSSWLVPGGKATLVAMISISAAVITQHTLIRFGWL